MTALFDSINSFSDVDINWDSPDLDMSGNLLNAYIALMKAYYERFIGFNSAYPFYCFSETHALSEAVTFTQKPFPLMQWETYTRCNSFPYNPSLYGVMLTAEYLKVIPINFLFPISFTTFNGIADAMVGLSSILMHKDEIAQAMGYADFSELEPYFNPNSDITAYNQFKSNYNFKTLSENTFRDEALNIKQLYEIASHYRIFYNPRRENILYTVQSKRVEISESSISISYSSLLSKFNDTPWSEYTQTGIVPSESAALAQDFYSGSKYDAVLSVTRISHIDVPEVLNYHGTRMLRKWILGVYGLDYTDYSPYPNMLPIGPVTTPLSWHDSVNNYVNDAPTTRFYPSVLNDNSISSLYPGSFPAEGNGDKGDWNKRIDLNHARAEDFSECFQFKDW